MTGRARLALALRNIGFLLALAGALPALAATCTSNGSGLWTAIAWTGCAAPAAGDTVIIQAGNDVDLSTSFTTANALAALTVNGSLTMGNSGTNRTLSVSGNVTVAGTLDTWPSNNATHTLNIGGNFSNTGTFDGFVNANRVTNVVFNGTGAQSIGGGGTYEFNAITVSNTSVAGTTVTSAITALGTTIIASGATVTNNSTVTAVTITGLAASSTWRQGANSTLNVSGTLLALGTLDATTNTPNTVNYNLNGNQNVKTTTYNNLTLSTGGTKTPAAGTLNVTGNLLISTGVTMDVNNNDPTINVTGNVTVDGTYTGSNTGTAGLNISGNFTRTGTFTSNAARITFNSTTAAQTITGATTFTNLTFANTTSAGVTLGSNVTVSGTGAGALTLNGIVATGGNTLIVSDNGATVVTRTSGFVDGNLQRLFPNAAATRTFDVGSGGRYAPYTITFAASPGANTMTVSTTTGDHPNIGTSAIDPNFTVSRYWNVTSAIVQTYSAVFTFVNDGTAGDDVDDDTNTAAFIVQRFAGGTWNNTTIGTRTATTTQITGATGFGAFQIGEPRPTLGSASFNAVEVADNAVTGVIKTKVAASGFNLDLVALNAARNAISTAFKGPVSVELLDATNNSAGLDANGCRATWTNIQTFSTTFSAANNGRRTTAFLENNIYQDVRVRVKYTIAGTDLLVGCSSDNFAIRPSTFASFTVSDQDWESAGTGRLLNNTGTSGGAVHKAGRPFTMQGTAVNAVGTTMTAYPATSSPIVVVNAAVEPAGGATGGVTPGTWSISGGIATTTTATFSEAGVVTLHLEDQTFAAVDASDGSTTAERYVVGPDLNVGRFVPDHFAWRTSSPAPSTPQFQTFGSACATRSFTYVGQSFWYATLPAATLEARNVAGNVTTNYRGALFKLTGLTNNGLSETYSNNATGPGLDVAMIGTPSLTAGNGTGAYSANSGGTILYTRDTATPIAPFTSNISLTVSASDNSEASFAGNGTIATPSALVFNGGGTGIAYDAGAAFRYGRARMLNGAGPTTVDVPVTLTTEYYASAASGFMLNSADNCTSFAAGNFKLYDHQGGITTTNMPDNGTKISISGNVSGGKANLKLVKPTGTVSTPGSLKICLDLATSDAACAATAAGLGYLQGPWGAATYTRDPSAQMAYGLYGAQPKSFIFFRENY